MAVAANSKITDLDCVRPDVANQCRSNEKAIAIEFNTPPVVVVMEASLDCVALMNEILAKDIRNVDILMSSIKSVQRTIRVLFQHREEGRIVLDSIVVQ